MCQRQFTPKTQSATPKPLQKTLSGKVPSPQAKKDLLQIGRDIAISSQSRCISLAFLDKIEQRCELYATQPEMAKLRPDLGERIHQFAVDDYLVIYRAVRAGIELLHVVHGKRELPKVLRSRLRNR